MDKSQIDKLADFIMADFPEAITEGGAGDVAIEIMTSLRTQLAQAEGEVERLRVEIKKAYIEGFTDAGYVIEGEPERRWSESNANKVLAKSGNTHRNGEGNDRRSSTG